MRKTKKPKIGAYVLATRWPDKDPNDPWAVGYVDSVLEFDGEIRVTLGERRQYRHFWNISEQEGQEIIDTYPLLEISR